MDKMTKLLEQAKRLAGRDTELGAVLELIDEERDNGPEATLGRVSTALQPIARRFAGGDGSLAGAIESAVSGLNLLGALTDT